MKAIGIFAIDSWHLVGGHFPSVRTTQIYDTIADVIDTIMTNVDAYKIEDVNHKRITREDIEKATEEAKCGTATVHFQYPREGEITIVFEH
jgi:hypothetical protein